MTQPSLSRRVATATMLGFFIFWLIAVIAAAFILTKEQKRLVDVRLREAAEAMAPLLIGANSPENAVIGSEITDPIGDESSFQYVLLNTKNRPAYDLENTTEHQFLIDSPKPGYAVTDTHIYYLTAPNADGHFIALGDRLIDWTAVLQRGFIAFLVPMIALLPLIYFASRWIAFTSLKPIFTLRDELGKRGPQRLDPISIPSQPQELVAMTQKLNTVMERLSNALERERTFASNAAHELRTPLAILLAQTQRLASKYNAEIRSDVQRMEDTIHRMRRHVTRILELARAEKPQAPRRTDLTQILQHVIRDVQRGSRTQHRNLEVRIPNEKTEAVVDPEGFAIISSNLIENALRHSPEGAQVIVELMQTGDLIVSNDCDAIAPEKLENLKHRYRSRHETSEGFGIGLHICETMATQAGGTLTLQSPVPGTESGFEARFSLLSEVPPLRLT